MKPVKREDGKWLVLNDNDDVIAGPFDTEDDAWDWINEHSPNPPSPGF